MKKLFTFLSRANNNSVGISLFNHRRVSSIYSMITLVAIMLMVPSGVKAMEGEYVFSSQSDTQVTYNTDQAVSGYKDGNYPYYYFTKIGGISNPTRFASSYTEWSLIEGGLKNNKNGIRKLLISQLEKGEVVTIITSSGTVSLNSSSDECTDLGNQSYRMKEDGALIVDVSNYGVVQKITIAYQAIRDYYNYDKPIESYDFYWVDKSTTFTTSDAGFPLNANDYKAQYLTLSSGLSLNNRIAVSEVYYDNRIWTANELWTFSRDGNGNESQGLKVNYGWQNLSICNLKEGDRVRIQFNGQAKFSSKAENTAYNGCAAFRDTYNNGELMEREGDVEIECGMNVECPGSDGMSYYYTILEDGHLDIALSANTRLYKVEIYSDHQAVMLDRYNGSTTTGYTAYFESTGQLMAKEHIVPGGLNVYIGNSNESQHAIVEMSDRGPVSFVYDQGHYKMPRQANNSMNVSDAIPETGTFYKFVPEVSGTMTVNFKAVSIRYANYWNGDGTSEGNEQVKDHTCPYYIMVKDNNSFYSERSRNYRNGENGSFEIEVQANKVYYMYGWWNRNGDLGNEDVSCGVAELIDVTFVPNNMVYPLAKCVPNGTKQAELAYVSKQSDIKIKKMSENIADCTWDLVKVHGNEYQLVVTDIQYKEGKDQGGVILFKIGNPRSDNDPVFALTIAYSAGYNTDETTGNSEGHTWDFSTNPLRGLRWTNTNSQADDVDFGTEAGPGLLYDEMHETNPDGTTHSDWTFVYRVKSGDKTHDPMYLNKYDMEGDNADMMWDTEGLIFNTASNQSCINNEFGGVVDHSKTGTRNDPDRYVGILPGGSFTIPYLEVGDRVCIYMGSGDGSGTNACKFNITGALDAIGQTISSSEIYNAGGSPWQYNMGNESRYRGAYQFISTGGDMTFTMNGGSMTKLYSITIYRGVKSATNDATKYNYDLSYNGDEYIATNNAWWLYNDYRTETPARSAYALHYRGKGERLKKPTVLHTSGNINTNSEHLMVTDDGLNILFKSEKEQYGMFRMRIEDYELNNKYVADYALQNIAVGYLQNKTYPYTWDFTDLTGYVNTSTRIQKERTNVTNYAPRTVDTNHAYEIEFMNNSVGEDVKAVEQWKSYEADGDIPAGYGLHVRNEPYNGGVMWESGQLYAGDEIFAESFGLSFSTPEVNETYNGGLRISNDKGKEGLCLTGGNWKITIPEVGTSNAVYVRAQAIGDVTAGVGDAETAFTYEGTATDGTGDKIYAVKGTGADMALFFNNLIIKKIAISNDPKTVNHLGYATESRVFEIDPELMGYMTGTGLKAYTVTNVTYGNNAGDIPSITLSEIGSEYVMGPAGTKDHRGYIIYNTDKAVAAPVGATADAEGKTKAVNILDGGFHLFVPDMHDESTASDHKKDILETENGKNYLRSHTNSGNISQYEGVYTNYLMNYIYYDKYGRHEGPEAFYRAGSGATLGNNKAYLQLLTDNVKPTDANDAKTFAIIFEDEFNGINPGITTVIDNASLNESVNEINAEWYNLNGQKLNGMPSSRGLYIINGKKVVVK